jgi:ribosome-associated protein
MMKPNTITEVVIKTPYIQLGQLVKLMGLVQTGGEVKPFLIQHPIQVNQHPDQRRGRKLYPGDLVVIGERQFLIKGYDH